MSPTLPEGAPLAQVGYHAYAARTHWKNYAGLPMPTWDALPEPQRTAWFDAARAIVESCAGIVADAVSDLATELLATPEPAREVPTHQVVVEATGGRL